MYRILLLGLIIWSCTSTERFDYTSTGYPLKFHINEEGDRPGLGDEVFYRMYVRRGDSVIHKSHDNINERSGFVKAIIPKSDKARRTFHHLDALYSMSPGDSATLYYPLDTVSRVPRGFQGETHIYYDIVLISHAEVKPVVKKVAKPLPIDDYELTPRGYPIVFHKNEPGESPKIGDYIYFRMYLRNDNEVVFSTSKNKTGEESYKSAQFIMPAQPSPQMDAFSIMSPGDSLTLYFQIDTLNRKPSGFENSDMVYYDIVLLDVLNAEEHNRIIRDQKRAEEGKLDEVRKREPALTEFLSKTVQQYKNGELEMRIRTTSNGLKYMPLEEGKGAQVETSSYAFNHFICMLDDGKTVFSSSYPSGKATRVLIGERKVIPGWESGLRLMKEGGKAVLFVPPSLAYGEKGVEGQIPPGAELVFYIDLVEVK